MPKLIHQLLDFLGRGAVADRLGQAFLRLLHALKRARQTAILDQKRDVPKRVGGFVPQIGAQRALRQRGVQPPHGDAQHQIGALVAQKPFGPVGHRVQKLRGAGAVAAGPEEVAAQFHDGVRHRVEEAATGQRKVYRIAGAGLVATVRHLERHADGEVGPGMFRRILDQRFGKLRARSGDGKRQVIGQRIARLGRGGQAIAAVDLVHVQRDNRPPGGDCVIVGCGKGLRHGAFGIAQGGAVDRHRRRRVRQDGQLPVTRGRPADGKAPRPDCLELKRLKGGFGLGSGARVGGQVGDVLVHRDVAGLAVKPQDDAAAFGQGESIAFDGVQIDAGLAGIGRRFGPAFPRRPGGQRPAGAARHRDPWRIGDPPERSEAYRHHQRGQGGIAQREGVARGKPQIGHLRPRGPGPFGHPRDMGAPDGKRACIARAKRLRIGQRRDGPPRQAGVEPFQRLGPRRPAELPHAARQRPDQNRQNGERADPQNLDRKPVMQAEGQRSDNGEKKRPDRPEAPRDALGQHPGPRQAHGP